MVSIEVCKPLPDGGCGRVDYFIRDSVIYFEGEYPLILFKHDPNTRVFCEGYFMQVFTWVSEKYTIWGVKPGGKCVIASGGVLEDHGDYYVYLQEPGKIQRVKPTGLNEFLILVLKTKDYIPLVVDDASIASTLINAVHIFSDELNRGKILSLLGNNILNTH